MVIRPEYFRFFKMERLCPERIGIRLPEFDGVACKIDIHIMTEFLKENRPDLLDWAMKKDELPILDCQPRITNYPEVNKNGLE